MAADALLTVFLGVAILALTLKIASLPRGPVGDSLGFVRHTVMSLGRRRMERR